MCKYLRNVFLVFVSETFAVAAEMKLQVTTPMGTTVGATVPHTATVKDLQDAILKQDPGLDFSKVALAKGGVQLDTPDEPLSKCGVVDGDELALKDRTCKRCGLVRSI